MITLSAFQRLTKLNQSLFAFPFVLAGALLPFVHAPLVWENRFLWIFPAFFCARISGMAFNQLIDRHIDKQNPRTQKRVLPAGHVSSVQATFIAVGTLLAFVLTCLFINPLCFALSFLAAFLIVGYSYTKRFSALCHFILGTIQLLGPVMAYAAVTNHLALAPLFLGISSLFLIAGSDIIYALQDVAFDRAHKLYSIPAKVGVEKSLGVAKGCHALAALAFLGVGFLAKMPPLFFVGPFLALGMLHFLHKTLGQALKDKRGVMPLFTWTNTLVALVVFTFTLLAALWGA